MTGERSPAEKGYIQLDGLAEKIGEDPGRYLDGPLPPLPRIRGLRTIHRVRAFSGAERRIASIRGREPRSDIMDALERRERYLEEHGEYDPDLPDLEIVLGITPEVLENCFDRQPGTSRIEPSSGPSFDPDDAPEGVTYRWNPEASRERLSAEEAPAAPESAVATDGGEPSDE